MKICCVLRRVLSGVFCYALSGYVLAAQPNVIIVLADDLGWGDVGYQGSVINTPALDALATSGVVLDRYYAQPTCSPTRAALMTGQSNLRLGVVQPIDKNLQYSLPLDVRILPQYFQRAGYQTWLVGKWHLGHAYSEQLPMARGFEHAYGNLLGGVGYWDHVHGGGVDWQRNGQLQLEEGYATHLLTAEALELLQARDQHRPFMMYLSYNAPHLPNEAPQSTIDNYTDVDSPRRRVHAAMVEEMDGGIGQLVAALEALGIRDNTLIWFMSDNGGLVPVDADSGLGRVLNVLDWLFDAPYPWAALEFVRSNALDGGADNGPFRGGKGGVYEGGTRVPSLLSWPGMLPPAHITQRLTVMDVLPTLVDLAGIAASKEFDGVSQWPLLTGSGTVVPPDYVAVGYAGGEAYYRDDWKLLALSGGEIELYNLAQDPRETHNLAAQYPEKVRELQRALERYPRGPSIHHTSILDILMDPDKFGGGIDRPAWIEQVREGRP